MMVYRLLWAVTGPCSFSIILASGCQHSAGPGFYVSRTEREDVLRCLSRCSVQAVLGPLARDGREDLVVCGSAGCQTEIPQTEERVPQVANNIPLVLAVVGERGRVILGGGGGGGAGGGGVLLLQLTCVSQRLGNPGN